MGNIWGNYIIPPLKFLATSLPALIVGEENLVIGFAPPHTLKIASAIAVLFPSMRIDDSFS